MLQVESNCWVPHWMLLVLSMIVGDSANGSAWSARIFFIRPPGVGHVGAVDVTTTIVLREITQSASRTVPRVNTTRVGGMAHRKRTWR